MMNKILLGAVAVLAFNLTATASDAPAIPCWQPHDFSFTATTQPANPFMVAFSANVTGPDGETFTMPGFFDGKGTWKIRVSPTAEGQWSLATKSELPELNGKTIAFTCVTNANPIIHGVLGVDREHPYHFIFADGTRFFLQGYEYDWLWALDMDKPGVPTIEKTVDLIASNGFNYVIVNTYALDTTWCAGKTGPDDFGPPLLQPWAGSVDAPDQSRMNLAYWQHYDLMMNALYKRGIEVQMFIKVYNKQVKWPAHGSDEEKLYFRWLMARYAAYPNLIWDFSKEAHNEKDLAYKQDWLKYIRVTDPYHHLVTIDDDDEANDGGAYDGLTDFRSDQQHRRLREVVLGQRERRAWPVVNVEYGYEHGLAGLVDKTYHVAQPSEEIMRRAWEIAMAGGYTAYYYTYTAWDVIRPLDVPPGYALLKHFGDFWRLTDYWLLQPTEELVSRGWCRADPGREYVTYQSRPTSFTLVIAGAAAPLPAEWFNPRTGTSTPAGSLGNGTTSLKPPADWGNGPVVLHLKAK